MFFSKTVLMFLALVKPAFSTMAYPEPFVEKQPNGELIILQLHGDPSDSYTSDLEGKRSRDSD